MLISLLTKPETTLLIQLLLSLSFPESVEEMCLNYSGKFSPHILNPHGGLIISFFFSVGWNIRKNLIKKKNRRLTGSKTASHFAGENLY